ncbi:hypothetical protein WG902_07675 [Ramlibacter sp. PS3R-8]|uniref:hypothetical protein n=1 Tax=Ramlibacter sp. PS3R-8 TaxID=3133437 RepID=UPI0030A193FF
MDDRALDELEQQLITSLRVLGVLFGTRSAEHAEWARSAMPADAVEHYLQAWREGRRRNWKDLQRMGQRIRKVSGDEGLAWQSRLAQLELLSGTQVADIMPTTRSGVL